MAHKNKFQTGAVELCTVGKGTDMVLKGTKALIEVNDSLAAFLSREDTDRTFKNIIGVGNRCHYVIESFNQGEMTLFERGIGTVASTRGGKVSLEREICIGFGDSPKYQNPSPGNTPREFEPPFTHIRAMTVTPHTYVEALASPNSVIASIGPFNPTPVEIDDNSLLGRKDNMVQSIDMDELREMMGDLDHDAVEAIVKTQKQLKLKARRIDLERKDAAVSASVLRALPSYDNDTKPPAQKGSIIYNTTINRLEVFNGTEWKTVAWLEEE